MNNDRFLLINLFDIYHSLLSKKQTLYFKLHFFDDWSFSEISEQEKISKSAVFDAIEKTKNKLIKYEKDLKILTNKNKRIDFYNKIDDELLRTQLLELE